MKSEFTSNHFTDQNGNPAGGTTYGTGFTISWQHGPLGRGEDRRSPNGAFVEDILWAAMDRIKFYQEGADGKFWCDENSRAIFHIEEALRALKERTARREKAGTEGTHQGC
jgi:hypothetical protein